MEAEIITFGATVTALRVPDQNGEPVDVVLGYRNVAGYERNEGFVGALVGRYANRIADASCLIDGERVALEPSEGPKSLHGGVKGFSYRVFDAEVTGDSPAHPHLHCRRRRGRLSGDTDPPGPPIP